MMRYAALLLMLVCSSAHADTLQPSYVLHRGIDGGWLECDGAIDCTKIPGQRGIWFSLSTAEQLVLDHKTVDELRAAFSDSESKSSEINDRLATCQTKLSLSIAEAHGAEASVDDALHQAKLADERARAAEDRADAWYNRKLLWYGAGVLSAVGVLIGAMVIAH